MSSQLLESEIRDLAYSKWEEAGCPFITCEDERNRFWYDAEKELLAKNSCCDITEFFGDVGDRSSKGRGNAHANQRNDDLSSLQ
ncbi:MAG: DUF2934 domain-containing protein [Syntrophaceae bacterium]|nr:DUF2934 domain-containing protein [Syntrophaceae bacterium]